MFSFRNATLAAIVAGGIAAWAPSATAGVQEFTWGYPAQGSTLAACL
jgi:hypothetical protein